MGAKMNASIKGKILQSSEYTKTNLQRWSIILENLGELPIKARLCNKKGLEKGGTCIENVIQFLLTEIVKSSGDWGEIATVTFGIMPA